MFAIASILNTTSEERPRALWNYLSEQCNLFGIFKTPIPHMTWQVADEYKEKAKIDLQRCSKSFSPIRIKVSGIGIFTGETPVVYLSLVKTYQMMKIHRVLWDILEPHGINRSIYYAPDQWMPHITIAYQDITRDNLSCAIKDLAFEPLDAEFIVDNLSLIYTKDNENGVAAKYSLLPTKGQAT